jgi:alpha,alpha-trehalase
VRCSSPTSVIITKTDFDAVLFDLDGVVTDTAVLHAAAWKQLFDEYLQRRPAEGHPRVRPFAVETDFRQYVDGKPRYEGVRSFLQSRGIALPYGEPTDPPGRETVCGLGNRKDELFHRLLRQQGVRVFPSTVAFIRRLKDAGIKTAVVSSSKNCAAVLHAAGLAGLFDARVDGLESARLYLKGKPAPDTFLGAAARLGADPRRAVVVEDALAGVQAGRAGHFGLVIGVARQGDRTALRQSGADVVVDDLGTIGVSG